MSLGAPRHVSQLTAGGRFPNGQPSGAYDCTVAVGVMALDAYTGGAIVPSSTAFRAAQTDQSGGIGLDDVAVAWRKYGQRFTYGARTWGAIMDRLRAGNGVAIQGSYLALGPWRAPGSRFTGGHALWLQRVAPGGAIVVDDPLRTGPTAIPEGNVARFYLSGLALAGWGDGVYAGTGDTAIGADAKVWTVAEWLRTSLGVDDSHVITATDVDRAVAWYVDKLNAGPQGAPDAGFVDGLRALLRNAIGKPVGTMTLKIANPSLPSPGVGDLGASFDALAASIGAIPGQLVNGLAHVGLLGGIVLLGLMGVWLTFRESTAIVLPGGSR